MEIQDLQLFYMNPCGDFTKVSYDRFRKLKRTYHRRLFIMKKTMVIMIAVILTAGVLSACGASGNGAGAGSTAAGTVSAAGSMSGTIDVISREDGSGTRGAFIELFGVEEKGSDGKKTDNTTEDAEITNSTEVMITSVSGDRQAIGYISLGSLNDSVKALQIDGAEATVADIKAGTYKISRHFNIVTKGDVSANAKDFIRFIFSADGQKVVEDSGYISKGNEGAYTASGLSGKVTVAGSSSVTPVMEKIAEAYKVLNPNVTVEVQQSDSTTGVTSAIDGVCDIGMASRDLKDTETAAGAESKVIAMDGIAVIVNKENPVKGLTKDQIKSIYTGETARWDEIE